MIVVQTVKVGYTTIMGREITLLFEQVRSIFPFSMLSEDQLRECIRDCDYLELLPGTKIFNRGELADKFFFILDGTVKVSDIKKGLQVINTFLKKDDHFGEEAIHGSLIRKSSAESIERTRLLTIGHDQLQRLIKANPLLDAAFSLFYQTSQVVQKTHLSWLTQKESVQLACKRHKIIPLLRLLFFNILGLAAFSLILFTAFSSDPFSIFLMVLAILALLGGFLTSLWAVAEWSNDYFIITSDRVLVQRQLYGFFDSRQESPISAILSTGFDTTLVGRLIGFGKVFLRSYTGEISFKYLPYPQTIFDLLEYQREKVSAYKKVDEKRVIQETLSNRLSGTNESETRPNRVPSEVLNEMMIYQSGSILDWLARFFQLRQVKGSSVIYRTHWWILFRKTIFPFILLLVLLVGTIFRLVGMFSTIPETVFYTAVLILTIGVSLWWFYQYADWHNDQYILTKDQILDVSRKPLGYEDRRSAPVKNIQTVEFKRKGLIGLLLNFGTVRIQIGNEELTFDNVYSPSQIQGEVYLHLKRYQEEQQRLEGQKLAEWITTYDDLKKEPGRENQNQSK